MHKLLLRSLNTIISFTFRGRPTILAMRILTETATTTGRMMGTQIDCSEFMYDFY